jgi:hypothetical protein
LCKKISFICCTYKEQYKVYTQHLRNGITYEKCHKWIDVDFRKIQKQISSNLDYGWRIKTWYKIWLQIKRGKANCSSFEQTWPRPFIGDDGKSTLIAFVGRAGYGYLFLYMLLTLTRGPDTIFLNWNLLPSNIIPHKQHQKIRK